MIECRMLLAALLRATLRARADLVAENLLLRHQLAVLTRPTRRRQGTRTTRPGASPGVGQPIARSSPPLTSSPTSVATEPRPSRRHRVRPHSGTGRAPPAAAELDD